MSSNPTLTDNILKPAMMRVLPWLTDDFIQEVELKRNCKFVGEFPVRPHSTQIGALFWQPNPPRKEYSNYFFLYINYTGMENHPDNGKLFITSGEHMDHRILGGIRTKNGHFIYSRGRHDFVEFDGSVVDGGDSYMRCNASDTVIQFQIVEDNLVELKKFEDTPSPQQQQQGCG